LDSSAIGHIDNINFCPFFFSAIDPLIFFPVADAIAIATIDFAKARSLSEFFSAIAMPTSSFS
jgi:hypothetical protein